MSLNVGRAKLNSAWDDLMRRWEKATRDWDDPKSRQFFEEYIKPIESQMRTASGAMDQMSATVSRAKSECS